MRQIEFADVDKRLRYLSKISASNNRKTFSEETLLNIKSKRVNDIKRYIESAGRSSSETSFNYIIELYDALCDNGSTSDISKMGNYICEEVIPKIRDAKSIGSLIKRRMTRLQNKLKTKDLPEKPEISGNKNKEKAIKEAYKNMLEISEIYQNCDRMLENYNNISKRFNLEVVINENTKNNGIYDTIIELCNRIDTYNIPTAVKFNTVIELALYGFNSNFITYKKSDILEAALDYFAFKENGIEECKKILDATLFFNKDEDMGNIDILTEEEPEDDSGDSSIDSIIRSHYIKDNKNNPKVVEESNDFGEIFNKFKKEELPKEEKPEGKLHQLITKLYARNVDSITNDTPDLLRWIRSFFIIGSCAIPMIGPVLAIIGYISDRFISLHMSCEETKKMIKCFNNEIKATKKKIESSTNSEDKDRLEKYLGSLQKALDNITSYYMEIASDEELDVMYSGNDSFSTDLDIDDSFNFDIDSIDLSIDEIASIMEGLIDNNYLSINENIMYGISEKLDNNMLLELSHIVSNYPDELYKESFYQGIYDELGLINNSKYPSVLEKGIRRSTLEEAISILNIKRQDSPKTMTVMEALNTLSILAETYSAISIIESKFNNSNSQILETSFSNTIKLASMKLRNAFKKMSDKEKRISKSIDLSMNNLSKSAEKALTTDNREAIIKGSILPSASKALKLAITSAGIGLIFHTPIAAIISVLGYLGCSAKFKVKERQMIIDEIEIELKMCDKYIEIAESKNDMKALKQLLSTKRDLERQLQRVKYKLKIEMGKNKYEEKHIGDK